MSPSGIRVEYTHPTVLAHVVDRAIFDRHLADLAVAAGASASS